MKTNFTFLFCLFWIFVYMQGILKILFVPKQVLAPSLYMPDGFTCPPIDKEEILKCGRYDKLSPKFIKVATERGGRGKQIQRYLFKKKNVLPATAKGSPDMRCTLLFKIYFWRTLSSNLKSYFLFLKNNDQKDLPHTGLIYKKSSNSMNWNSWTKKRKKKKKKMTFYVSFIFQYVAIHVIQYIN